MNVDLRAVQTDNAHALERFFADVPDEDRTFFKEEIGRFPGAHRTLAR